MQKSFSSFFARLFIFTALYGLLTPALAQSDLIMGTQPGLLQSQFRINPAFTADEKLTIAIPPLLPPFPFPSFGFSISNSTFALSDIIKPGSNGTTLIDVRSWLDNARSMNSFCASLQMDFLSAGIRINDRHYISLHAGNRVEMNFEYSRDMLSLLIEGNGAGDIIGTEQNPEIYVDGIHYTSIGVGYSTSLMNARLRTGIRLERLTGQEHLKSERSETSLYTDPIDFSIRGSADILLRTSGLDNGFFQGESPSTGRYLLNSGNNGWSVDAGFQYAINDKWLVAAALNDLGFIRWNKDIRSYSSKEPGANIEFSGVDVFDYSDDSISVEEAFEELTDSLKSRFDLIENTDAYTSMLNMRTTTSVTFRINKKQSASLLINNRIFNRRLHPDISLSYSIAAGRWLKASLAWSIIDRNAGNLGMLLSINPGPFQWYICSDNILGLLYYDRYQKIPIPAYTRYAGFCLGFNLTLGKTKVAE